MIQRYSAQGYPSEFPVRSKCIALFQKIHGVETLLFAMYVYEYGHDCPAPNKRRVYISYLDSVQYFEPKCYRTTAYHAIIIEYLRYVKKRGFHTASIWSCPPVGGDDYIFYCHPKHQLVPREDMLRLWYHKMLDQAKSQGVVIRTTTLYDEYFTSDGVDQVPGQRRDPTCLPYFEGDYIPGEIENIIQQFEATGNSTAASQQDCVMVRIGHNLRKMKDNFIVVHLRNRRFAAAVERGEDVSNWKEDSDDEMLRSKRAKISGKCSAEPDSPMKNLPLETVASFKVEKTVDDPFKALTVDDKSKQAPTDEPRNDNDETKGLREREGADVIRKELPTEVNIDVLADTNDTNIGVVADDDNAPAQAEQEEKSVPVMKCDEDASPRVEHSMDDSRPGYAKALALTQGDQRKTDVMVGCDKETGDADEMVSSGVEADGKIAAGRDLDGVRAKDLSIDTVELPLTSCCVTGPDAETPVHDESRRGGIGTDVAAVNDDESDRKGELAGSDRTIVGGCGSDAGAASVKEETLVSPAEIGSATDATFELDKLSSINADLIVESDMPPGAGADPARASDKILDHAGAVDERQSEKPEPVTTSHLESSTQKRALEEVKPAISLHFSGLNCSTAPVGDTTDEDPPMESEMFESRQQFLNYCQTTHCQFDELRRAKHSTVMVLFQLHNPMAPKFLQQCGACYRDITHGIRYHCNDCSNFDLCEDCYEPVTSGLWAKRDPRFAHDKQHSFMPVDMEAAEETQKGRAERQKSLKAHIELLEHVGVCPGAPACSLHNCERMKKLFLHVPSCDVKPKKDCKICTRLLALCMMHSRLCTARNTCPIPFCDRIRERNKRLRRQQQLMDDRRRQAQNELYRAGGEV